MAAIEIQKNHVSSDLHFSSLKIDPNLGMNLLSLKVFQPRDQKNFDLIYSKSQSQTKKFSSYSHGGALLAPFANRVRGPLCKSGEKICWKAQDLTGEPHTFQIPVNRSAQKEKLAIHGLIYDSQAENFQVQQSPEQILITGALRHQTPLTRWPGELIYHVEMRLEKRRFGVKIEAQNLSEESTPVGIGWHPYFQLPSLERSKIKLMLPVQKRAIVNNYEDVFPTGEFAGVSGTPYDFTQKKELGPLFLDDCFTGFSAPTSALLEDKASGLGVKIEVHSPLIKAFQVYSPLEKNFVAIEPQFNLPDPFSPLWKNQDTGLVWLKQNEKVSYEVWVEVYEV